MKKLLGIVVLGLLWCNVAIAEAGCILGNCRDGQGTFTWANGDKYVGEWKGGLRHGRGTLTLSNGAKYVGEYKDGKKSGQGTYTYPDGRIDIGRWWNDNLEKRTGGISRKKAKEKRKEKERKAEEEKRKAEEEKRKAEEERKRKQQERLALSKHPDCNIKLSTEADNSDNWIFTPEECYLSEEKIFNNGTYKGEFKNSKFHGKGIMHYDNQDIYQGEWEKGFMNGQGTYMWADGHKYEGEWEDDKKHGQGTETWTSGSKYVGEWKDDKEHGQGIYTYAIGENFEGEWKDGEKHGQGTYVFSNGSYQKGEWQNDKIVKGDFFINYVYKNGFIQILSNEVKLIEDNELVTTIPSNSEINFNNILGISKDYLIISYNNKKGNMERNPDDIFEKINIQDSYLSYPKNIGQMVKIYNEILDTTKMVEKYESSGWYNFSDKLKLRNAEKLLPTLELKLNNERQIILTEIEKEYKREIVRKIKEAKERRKKAEEERLRSILPEGCSYAFFNICWFMLQGSNLPPESCYDCFFDHPCWRNNKSWEKFNKCWWKNN
ncbi:hypothetical protein OAI48_00185 [Candidatus Pelagibacter sp.]|nr:hypothetical protein [Candidatus Pelagibacter sp.]